MRSAAANHINGDGPDRFGGDVVGERKVARREGTPVGGTALTCTIVLTSLAMTGGIHTTGTFVATMPLGTGGTKAITDGIFDLAGQLVVRN